MTSQSNRLPVFISLGLALALVVGTLVGAKLVFLDARQPITLAAIPAEYADSPECAGLIDRLPSKVTGVKRAELSDSVPGAAAWARGSQAAVTLRCGVDAPFQYTELSQPEEVDGVSWLEIADPTPGATARTWYAVDRFPVVAVTSTDDPRGDLSSAVATLEKKPAKKNPAPLSELAAGSAQYCDDLEAHLPEKIGDYVRRGTAWVSTGLEPIVLRCGVAFPQAYGPGQQITQINDVGWFEEPSRQPGSTAATWYALRDTVVAVSVPQEVGTTALVTLSDAIARAVPAES